MRFMQAMSGVSVQDTEAEIQMEANVSHDDSPAFKADWIEVSNDGDEVLIANPYHSTDSGGVTIPAGKTYRFEFASENQAARDRGGWGTLYLVSTPTGTTVSMTAGAD